MFVWDLEFVNLGELHSFKCFKLGTNELIVLLEYIIGAQGKFWSVTVHKRIEIRKFVSKITNRYHFQQRWLSRIIVNLKAMETLSRPADDISHKFAYSMIVGNLTHRDLSRYFGWPLPEAR